MRHRLLDLMNGQGILSGAIPGRRLLSALIAATPSAAAPTLALLDFSGVEVATASFLRESVIGFRDYARQSLQNVYPVVANLPPAVAEELDFFVRARGDVLLTCDLDPKNNVVSRSADRRSRSRPAGHLRCRRANRRDHRARTRRALHRPAASGRPPGTTGCPCSRTKACSSNASRASPNPSARFWRSPDGSRLHPRPDRQALAQAVEWRPRPAEGAGPARPDDDGSITDRDRRASIRRLA